MNRPVRVVREDGHASYLRRIISSQVYTYEHRTASSRCRKTGRVSLRAWHNWPVGSLVRSCAVSCAKRPSKRMWWAAGVSFSIRTRPTIIMRVYPRARFRTRIKTPSRVVTQYRCHRRWMRGCVEIAVGQSRVSRVFIGLGIPLNKPGIRTRELDLFYVIFK